VDHFYGIKKSSNETVNQFVARIVLAVRRLRNASVKCDKEQVIARIFYILPDDNLVVALGESRIVETNHSDTNGKVKCTWRKTQSTNGIQVSSYSTTNNGDDKKNKRKKKVNCFGCGKKGHIARDCSPQEGRWSRWRQEETLLLLCGRERREWLVDYEPYVVPVNVANGNQVASAGRGTILIRVLVEGEWSNIRLVDTLHVPSFDRNLFSTRKVVKRGCKMIGDAKTIKFEKNGRVVLAAVIRCFRIVDRDA